MVDLVVDEPLLSQTVLARQAVWAVEILRRENPPGRLWLADPGRIDSDRLDVDLALSELSRAVSRGDATQRLSAVDALVWLKDQRAVSPLIRALRDPEWDVRFAAADGLPRFAPLPDWCFAPLKRLIGDPEAVVRCAVARALGSLPNVESVSALTAAIGDQSREVRLAVAWALAGLGSEGFNDRGASRALGHHLTQEHDPFVAFAVHWALGWHTEASETAEQRFAFRRSAWGETVWETVTGQAPAG